MRGRGDEYKDLQARSLAIQASENYSGENESPGATSTSVTSNSFGVIEQRLLQERLPRELRGHT